MFLSLRYHSGLRIHKDTLQGPNRTRYSEGSASPSGHVPRCGGKSNNQSYNIHNNTTSTAEVIESADFCESLGYSVYFQG